jgi:hypothetical protein
MDSYQDRFLLAGNFTGAAIGITLGYNVLSITLSVLPWSCLLALVMSALAHPIFRWRLFELAEEDNVQRRRARDPIFPMLSLASVSDNPVNNLRGTRGTSTLDDPPCSSLPHSTAPFSTIANTQIFTPSWSSLKHYNELLGPASPQLVDHASFNSATAERLLGDSYSAVSISDSFVANISATTYTEEIISPAQMGCCSGPAPFDFTLDSHLFPMLNPHSFQHPDMDTPFVSCQTQTE